MKKLYKVKRTYDVHEAAERLSCTLNEPITAGDIIGLMGEEEIGIFWWLHHEPMRKTAPYCSITSAGMGTVSLSNDNESKIEYRNGIFRVVVEFDSTVRQWARELGRHGAAFEPIPFDGTLLQDSQGEFYELMEYKMERQEDGKYLTSYASLSKYPLLHDIVLTKDELDRFEAQFTEAIATEAGSDQGVGEIERVSLQKQIAALALLLAEKSRLYRNGDKPNGNRIAEAVATMLDAMPDANKRGVSSASLRASIKAGVEMLQGKRGGLNEQAL